MNNGFVSELLPLGSPDRDPGCDPSVKSPLEAKHKQRSLGAPISLMNTLDLSLVRCRLSSSTTSFTKSMFNMARFPDFPMFERHDDSDDSDDYNDVNDTTLNDEDLLSSPTMKPKPPATIRRTQSLFDKPSQVDIHFEYTDHLAASLISTFKVSNDSIPRIDETELKKIIDGVHADLFDEYIIIDCRFPYEFEGGHIVNAINIASQSDLEEHFIVNHSLEAGNRRRLLIFHCEYSIFRGPNMAGHLRKTDRIYNSERYPYLIYPDIVVLEGGYKRFFDNCKQYCFPQSYVEMKDNKHKRTCEVEMSKVLQASKLTRARSFNHFPPRLSISHARSSSLTTLFSSSEQNLALGTSTPALRKCRSSKIHKKERREV